MTNITVTVEKSQNSQRVGMKIDLIYPENFNQTEMIYAHNVIESLKQSFIGLTEQPIRESWQLVAEHG